jgi:lysyl-tRNA synthetase class 2
VQLVQKAGYTQISDLIDLNPNKLHQEVCGLNKKMKLELNNPSPEEVKTWVANASGQE